MSRTLAHRGVLKSDPKYPVSSFQNRIIRIGYSILIPDPDPGHIFLETGYSVFDFFYYLFIFKIFFVNKMMMVSLNLALG